MSTWYLGTRGNVWVWYLGYPGREHGVRAPAPSGLSRIPYLDPGRARRTENMKEAEGRGEAGNEVTSEMLCEDAGWALEGASKSPLPHKTTR